TRERPEPFSSTSSGAWICFAASHCLIACAASSARAGGPPSSAPSVRKSWRAMTLFENLLMSRTISASGSDSCTYTSRAPVDELHARQRRLGVDAHALVAFRHEGEAQRFEVHQQRIGRHVVRPVGIAVEGAVLRRTEVAAVEQHVAAQLAQAAAAEAPQQHPEALVVELRVAGAAQYQVLAVEIGLGFPAVGRPEELQGGVRRDELHHRSWI